MPRSPQTRLIIPLCACALLAARGQMPAARNGKHRVGERIKAELAALNRESRPLLKEAEALRARYGDPKQLDAVKKERAILRPKLQLKLDAVNVLDVRLDRFERANMTARATEGLAVVLAGGKPPADRVVSELTATLDYQDMRKEISALARSLADALKDDAGGFGKMRAAVQRKKRIAMLAATLIAGLILSVAIPFLLGRWKSAQDVPISAAATLPPQEAARLSGPAGALLGGPVQETPSMPEVLGGNFKIAREIGRGGMGLVYEAEDLALRRKVAIKRMKSEVVENKRELEMFLSEARMVASLKHPALVEIYSILREEGQLYLIFEFIAGMPLHKMIDEGDPLPLEKTVELLRQVAAGLDYAHSRKVIHRDLKPSNIMITAKGEAKVMDFGIAHQAKKTVAKLTRADAWGTPPYMAPEQELGKVSRESDYYSLGVCCYEMLTGRLPFPGPNYLAQKREMAHRPPSTAREGLPQELDAVLARTLDSDPAKRFHSGAEFTAALEHVPGASPARYRRPDSRSLADGFRPPRK